MRLLALLGLGLCCLVVGGCGASTSETTSSRSSSTAASATPPGTPEDTSIKNYGGAASGPEQAQLTKAMFSFFAALADSEGAKICAALTAPTRSQIEAFAKAQKQPGGCPAVLAQMLAPAAAHQARGARGAKISAVRVKGDSAFVLFRPKGGGPEYFVMKREGKRWKATGLAPGIALDPRLGTAGH